MTKPHPWQDPTSRYSYSAAARNAGCTGKKAPGEFEAAQGCISEFYTNYTFIPGEATVPAGSPMLTQQSPSFDLDWTAKEKMPWRAPGSAPVFSPCGHDGGNPKGCPVGNRDPGGCDLGGYGHGPDARLLPGNLRPEIWKAGDVVEVGWGITANHGGGYSYRLCRLPAEGRGGVTEACFQQTPLSFVGDTQWIHFDTGSRVEIPAVRSSEGTTPAGSQWTRNPVPGCFNNAPGQYKTNGNNGICNGPQFEPPIPGLYGFNSNMPYGKKFPGHHIVDMLQVPSHLAPGDYVISFRYDCEQTSQVWATCGDVRISGVAPPTPAPTPAPTPTPAPAAYKCFNGQCRVSAGGLSKEACEQVCLPGPQPTGTAMVV